MRKSEQTNRRGKEIIKMLNALQLLARDDGASIREISAQLEVSERSAWRLLALLQELGVPLVDQRRAGDRSKRWRVAEGYAEALPNMFMISVPAAALILLREAKLRLRAEDASLADHADRVFGMLEAMVRSEGRSILESGGGDSRGS